MTNVAGRPGQLDLTDQNDWFAAIAFAFKMFMGKISTATLVEVVAVYPAGEAALGGSVGWVDVKPMVNMVDGVGNAVGHGTIYQLPYFRLQGGASAVIMDPDVGNVGMAAFASRDISAVKRTKAVSNPGSFRRFDLADGMYFGGFLNGIPTQFLEFLADNGGVKVTTPGNLVISAANATLDASGNLTVNGEVVWNNGTTPTHASTHTHSGVQTGTGNSGAPNAGT